MTIRADISKAAKLLGSKGGKAGRGKSKARSSAQMRKAALKRWGKLKPFLVKSYRTSKTNPNILRVRRVEQ